MHGSAVVFPVVLALAREYNASERNMIAAFIVVSIEAEVPDLVEISPFIRAPVRPI